MLRSAVILALIVSGLSLHADALDHWKYGEISGTGEDVAFGNGKFVAVGVSDSGSFIALSTNGTTWTQQPIPGLRSYPTVCFGDGKFIALTSYGAIAASTNGTHWESSILPDFGLAMTDITHAEGRFVAVGYRHVGPGGYDYRAIAYTSTNGIDWTNWMSTAVSRMNAVAYGNGRFVAVGGGFNTDPAHRIFTSSNSVDWTSHASTENQFYGIAFGGGQFVATTGGRRMLTSTDGETWVAHTNNATNVFVSAITYGNGTFVAVGSQNQSQHTVLYSYNGTNWQSRYFGPVIGNYFLNGVAFGAGTFVAVGMPPSVLQSENVHRPFLTLSAGDPLQFRLGGKVDAAFRLQSSSNLNIWDDVMTYTNVSPVMSLSIPATNSSSQLFFRSIQD